MRSERPVRAAAHILHADLDSFYASVEQRDFPGLRGRPVLVGDGVVLAASYEAKAAGVRTPMPGYQARQLCPRAITMRPRFAAYSAASREVFEIFHDTAALVEGISVDEAFLDVGGLAAVSGTPVEIAHRLRERVRADVGLPITVGVATTKFVAKVASAVGKPDGLLEVKAGRELEFLHPLPVRRLWGVGKATEARLADAGIATVGEIAALGAEGVAGLFGRGSGARLYNLAVGRDPRRVEPGGRRRSIGAQRALGRAHRTESEIEATLLAIVDHLGARLRASERLTRTVVLRLRFADFESVTRTRSLSGPTDSTEVILAVARGVLADAMELTRDRGCTLIGLSLTNLQADGAVQLALPFDGEDHAGDLDIALDSLRRRFGRDVVTRGVLVNRESVPDTPVLPG